MFLYSGFSFLFFIVLNSRSSGVAPTRQSLLIRFAHPTGRPSGAQQTTLSAAKKVTKNAVSLTAKLNHDGCISQCFLSSSFREIIAKRYRGYFFFAALVSSFTSNSPFEQNSSSTLFFLLSGMRSSIVNAGR